MALAGAEQDRHVGGSGLAHDAGLAIANRRRGQQANYLVRHSIGRLTDGLGDDEAQRTGGWWLVAGDWSVRIDRKPILLVVAEAVSPPECRRTFLAIDLTEDIVDEGE